MVWDVDTRTLLNASGTCRAVGQFWQAIDDNAAKLGSIEWAQDRPKVLMTTLSIGMVVVPSLLESTLMQVCAMGSLERESMHKPRLAVEGEEEDEEDRAVLGPW